MRFYIQGAQGYARFWRIEETTRRQGDFSVNIVFHGLAGKTPTVAGRWPERTFSTAELNGGIEFRYADMERLDYAANHFTLHANGALQLRLADGVPPYYLNRLLKVSPPGDLHRTSTRALDFFAFSDRSHRYGCVDPAPVEPACAMPARRTEVVLMRVWASGADHDLESEARSEISQLPVDKLFVRAWNMMKIAWVQWRERPPAAAFALRAPGTHVAFRSNTPDGTSRVTAFAFA